jgi:hypothetical protein
LIEKWCTTSKSLTYITFILIRLVVYTIDTQLYWQWEEWIKMCVYVWGGGGSFTLKYMAVFFSFSLLKNRKWLITGYLIWGYLWKKHEFTLREVEVGGSRVT